MFVFQNIAEYMGYFKKSPPLALAGVSAHARECGERHDKGVLGCKTISDDYRTHREFKAEYSDLTRAEGIRWWIERQRDCPLLISVSFDGAESLKYIKSWESILKGLSQSEVEHMFDLQIKWVESLLPFTGLLLVSEGIVLEFCSLTTLEALRGLKQLRSVTLWSSGGAFSLDPLTTCPNLTTVRLSDCHQSNSVGVLGSLRNLKSIALEECGITDVDFLMGCPFVDSINVSECKNLTSLAGLGGLLKLKTVDASGSEIQSVEGLSGCVALESVNLRGCKNLLSFAGLGGLRKLKTVGALCTGIQSVRDLAGCVSLESVDVSWCENLRSLDGLGGLAKLRTIDTNQSGIMSIGNLTGCVALEKVNVSGCYMLTSLTGLAGLEKLRAVDAVDSAIQSIGDLTGCVALESVDVRGCRSLTSVIALSRLQNLTEVLVGGTEVKMREQFAFRPGVFAGDFNDYVYDFYLLQDSDEEDSYDFVYDQRR
ncbi:adenylate cyclase regulatory protein-like protein [Angomonas deanei]|nr:adenylate cyclase regulatory protein-like protein [Angomonas deanei]|eukprot:EPY16573.1 adenylate cyclase regulatory protein-like protein [Angomonas deanei]